MAVEKRTNPSQWKQWFLVFANPPIIQNAIDQQQSPLFLSLRDFPPDVRKTPGELVENKPKFAYCHGGYLRHLGRLPKSFTSCRHVLYKQLSLPILIGTRCLFLLFPREGPLLSSAQVYAERFLNYLYKYLAISLLTSKQQ